MTRVMKPVIMITSRVIHATLPSLRRESILKSTSRIKLL